jgi:MFS family permease
MKSNVLIYYLFKILSSSTMRGPILILFMTKTCNMPLTEVYLCEACCVVILVLLQIPMGILADKWGRARVIQIACFILFAELVTFATSTEHIQLWIGNALWAIGYSMVSGADTALLYDSLKQKISGSELENTYRNVEGKSSSIAMIMTALMCLISGVLASIDMRIPIMIDAFLMLGAMIVSLKFIEPKIHTTSESKVEFWSHIYSKINFVLVRKNILWIIVFMTLIGVSSKLWFFTYNPYFEMVGVDLKYFGVIFFALNIVSAVSSHYANDISKKIDNSYGIILSISILTIPMIAMGLIVSKWSIILVLCQNLVRGYLGPFTMNMLNREIESRDRATILSVKSAIYQGFEVICMALFSGLIHYSTLGQALAWLGVIASSFGLILTYYYVKLFRK